MSDISGHDDVAAALRQALASAVISALPDALRAGADVLSGEIALRAATKDPELRSAVEIDIEMDAARIHGTAVIKFGRTLSERTGQPLDAIAEWIELGHEMETHDRKPPEHGLTFVPASPFVRPAFDAAQDKAAKAFADTLAQSLKA